MHNNSLFQNYANILTKISQLYHIQCSTLTITTNKTGNIHVLIQFVRYIYLLFSGHRMFQFIKQESDDSIMLVYVLALIKPLYFVKHFVMATYMHSFIEGFAIIFINKWTFVFSANAEIRFQVIHKNL